MSGYYDNEALCKAKFQELGDCHHLWTPENHEIIFTNQSDFQTGMTLFGISAKLYPDISVLTFELMTNHMHMVAAGDHQRCLLLFGTFKDLAQRWLKAEARTNSLHGFEAKMRPLQTLQDIRNVILYNNRNGFIVSQEHTPFTYPWGANRYYFSPDSCRLAMLESKPFSLRERRLISHSRIADNAEGLLKYEHCALPLSFCNIKAGEALFRGACHYFNSISKCIESNALIAKEIGEAVWYTDDELYAILRKKSKQQYGAESPLVLRPADKIELAKMLHYEYNATLKQLSRMLKLDFSVLRSLGITK